MTPRRFEILLAVARPAGTENTLSSRVRAVPDALVPAIEKSGLRSASVTGLERLLIPAQTWLSQVPDLEHLVLSVVREIHPLAAEPGYDVSHSEPQWPEKIFVSCPERADDVGALRLIESVIHEAMHLHLTNQEEHVAFVAKPSNQAYSPWRQEERPVQGVMHGLFVFACIRRFLQALMAKPRLVEEAREYTVRRVNAIYLEIEQIDVAELSRSLTARGRASVASWVRTTT